MRSDTIGLDRLSELPVICRGAGPAGDAQALNKVLDCQDQLIVKLFPAEFSRSRVEEEVSNTLGVRSLGIGAPDIRALIEEGSGYGFVYAKISGTTLLQCVSEGIESLDYWAERFAFIHRGIHEHELEGMKPVKSVLAESISRANLHEAERDAVLRVLDGLPDGTSLCHGDFHPGNVIATREGFVIIDWANTVVGHCLADVAQTSILLDVWLPYKVKMLGLRINRRSLDFFHKTYVDSYLILSGEGESTLEAWRVPAAAARLAEGNPWERDGLLGIIRRAL
jgi:hypothetical protein